MYSPTGTQYQMINLPSPTWLLGKQPRTKFLSKLLDQFL
jgi:hypothetical protein